MTEILSMATILGGISAIWFFWDKIISIFKRSKTVAHVSIQGPDSEWEGIEIDGHFFAWRGPGLHLLQSWHPIAAPRQLQERFREAGVSILYDFRQNLSENYSKGRSQVFETDKNSWRREILLPGADQVLLVQSKKQ